MKISKLKIGVREKANRERAGRAKLERGARAIWVADSPPFAGLGPTRRAAAAAVERERRAF